MSMSSRHCSTGSSGQGPMLAPPALATTTSIRPWRSKVASMTSDTDASSVISAAMNDAPSGNADSGALRAQVTTEAPSPTRRSTMPRPIPVVPPVTTATRPRYRSLTGDHQNPCVRSSQQGHRIEVGDCGRRPLGHHDEHLVAPLGGLSDEGAQNGDEWALEQPVPVVLPAPFGAVALDSKLDEAAMIGVDDSLLAGATALGRQPCGDKEGDIAQR